eukprot:5617918-Pleurochrysis_carterae.AAC.1
MHGLGTVVRAAMYDRTARARRAIHVEHWLLAAGARIAIVLVRVGHAAAHPVIHAWPATCTRMIFAVHEPIL